MVPPCCSHSEWQLRTWSHRTELARAAIDADGQDVLTGAERDACGTTSRAGSPRLCHWQPGNGSVLAGDATGEGTVRRESGLAASPRLGVLA